MSKEKGRDILSTVQLILPKNVVDACYTLQRQAKATFLATNREQRTQTEIKIKRQLDESIRLSVTVLSISDSTSENTDFEVKHNSVDEKNGPSFTESTEEVAKQPDTCSISSAGQFPTGCVPEKTDELPKSPEIPQKFGEGLPPKMRRKKRRLSELEQHTSVETGLLPKIEMNKTDALENCTCSSIVLPDSEVHSYNTQHSESITDKNIEPLEQNVIENNTSVTGEQFDHADQNSVTIPTAEKDALPESDHFVSSGDKSSSESKTESSNSLVNVAAVGPFAKKKMRERNVQCKLCDSMLKNYDMLNIHVRRQHQQSRDFRTYLKEIWLNMKAPCPVCKKMLNSKNHIKSHIRFKHPEQAGVAEFTNMTENTNTNMSPRRGRKPGVRAKLSAKVNKEIPSAKPKGRPGRKKKQSVNADGKALEEDLVQYAEHCPPVKDEYQCKVCSKAFPLRRQLQRHIWTHLDPRFQCRLCDRKFNARDNMAKHIIRMHQADPAANIIILS